MNYVHSIETRINDITQKKLNMTNTIAELNTQINDIGDNDSPAVKKLEARKIELENFEKKLDIELQKLQAQLQAATTEEQSADQMLQDNISKSFSYKVA